MKEIQLTKGKVAMVDDEDFEELNKFSWYALKAPHTFYAVRKPWDRKLKKSVRQIYMHRVILQPRKDQVTDHIDGDGLNNTKNNLRACTQSENLSNQVRGSGRNTSGVPNVEYFNGKNKYWIAKLNRNKQRIFLGYFKTKEQAVETLLNYKKQNPLCKSY